MALGGGTFVTQNKILPGAYINFVSVANASASLSDRGVATLPLELNWGPENEMFTVELADFLKDSQKIFGYSYADDEMKPLREVFKHARTVHFFRLNRDGQKAACTYAIAKYPGTRGNSLKIVITANEASTETAPLYDVTTYLGTAKVDEQKAVSSMSGLVNNDYVDWITTATIALAAGASLTNGSNGEVENAAYQEYLDQAESYEFNAMGCTATNDVIKGLFGTFCRRMRDDIGKKFQCVVYNHLLDYEGVVSVKNTLVDANNNPALIPWVTGVVAGTAVNASASNMVYDGEYEVDTKYTQTQLEAGIREGSFMFHLVNGQIVVLQDINTFVSVTDEKSADFSSNQTIRVLDQIANDIAVLFAGKYIGKVPNDASGRISLWNDIVKHHQELQSIRAIEDFSPENVTVEPGDTKTAVVVTDYVTPVNAMEKLYMTVYVQ